MDRVHEPGDVSIPFRFGVHALIFSEDAAGLGRALHQEFEGHRVNRVNRCRAFFCIRPTDVRDALQWARRSCAGLIHCGHGARAHGPGLGTPLTRA